MNLFSTHGSLSKWCHETSRTYKNRVQTVTKIFCYPEPMDIHFLYRQQIDDHNHFRHQPIGLENLWGNNFWDDRVFTFLSSVTEINAYKLHHHFKKCPERSILDFRFELAFQMILNELPGSISNPEDFKKRKRCGNYFGHERASIPKFCGKWVRTGWRKVKQEYKQQLCSCGKKTRHYCRFNKAVPY